MILEYFLLVIFIFALFGRSLRFYFTAIVLVSVYFYSSISTMLLISYRFVRVSGITVATILSRPVPWLGSWLILDSHPVRKWVASRVCEDITDHRDRFEDMFLRERLIKAGHIDKNHQRKRIREHRQAVERRHRSGEFAITVIGGVISILLAVLGASKWIAVPLTLYLLIIPVSVAIRVSLVEIVMYGEGDLQSDSPTELLYRKYWNLTVRENPGGMVTSELLIGLLKGESDFGYNLGMEIIEKVASGEEEFEDALEQALTEVLGENATIPNQLKKALKRSR